MESTRARPPQTRSALSDPGRMRGLSRGRPTRGGPVPSGLRGGWTPPSSMASGERLASPGPGMLSAPNGMLPSMRYAAAPMTSTTSTSSLRQALETQAVGSASLSPDPISATNPTRLTSMPPCCLCASLIVPDDGFVKLRGGCKCYCCPRCFCEVMALSFACPHKHGGAGEPAFQFDAKSAARAQTARDVLLSHEFEGEIFDVAVQDELSGGFSKIKARFESDPALTFSQACANQITSDITAALQARASPQTLRAFGIAKLRNQALTPDEWFHQYGYTVEDLVEMGFEQADFLGWDDEDELTEDDAERLRLLGIGLIAK